MSFDGVSLKKGQHTLKVSVDSKNAVVETHEDNNQLSKDVDCKD